ncbi:MAG: hypothetical protein FJY48_08180 [Betaproteobacteria bacterium]|nr:hypothetical protein [Betaproteobacteria bacterium]
MAGVLLAAALAGALSIAGLVGATFCATAAVFLAGVLALVSVFLATTAPFLAGAFDAATGLAGALALGLLAAGLAAFTGFLAAALAAAAGFALALVGALLAGLLFAADLGLTVADFLAGVLAAALTDFAGFLAAAAAPRALATLVLSLVAEFFTVFLLVAMDRSTLGS